MLNPDAIPWVSTAVALLVIASTMAFGVWIGNRLHPPKRRVDEGLEASFFEQIRDAALVTENGAIIDVNPTALEQFGYSRSDMIGLRVTSLLWNPDDEERFVRALQQGPVTDFELRLRNSSGEALDCVVTATARFDSEGKIIGCRGLARDVTDRNRIVADLRRAEHDYRGLFENAYDAILILDPFDETVLDVNHQACVMYDLPREKFIGRSMVTLSVNPSRGKTLLTKTREGSGRYATFESQQLRRDGTIMDVEINAAELWYKGRRVILSINRDISSRRHAERSVRESEERLRLIFENVTDYAIVMLDPIGRIMSWNEGAERITGYSAAEVIGQSAAVFESAEEQEKLRSTLAMAASTGRVEYHTTRIRKDGTIFAASVTITRIVDDAGSLRGFVSMTHDITDREALERARQELVTVLRDVAQEWTATFDAVQVPIVMIDEDGEIRRLNRAAQSLARASFTQLIQRRVETLPGEPWRTIAQVAKEALDGDVPSYRAAEGESVWQVSSTITGTKDGRRAIVVAYDLTLVTQLEASVRRHEVAAALGSLVAGVAHEVRNPLFTISATLDAWEARFGRTEGIERYGGALREQVDRLNRLMRDLLEFGKPNPLVFEDGSLAKVIVAASGDCAALAAQQNVTIEHHVETLPLTALDAARMEQVFQNVIDNAIRYTPAGGKVRVTAALEQNEIVCHVVDEGPGLGGQDPERLFAPMYTRRRGGTGLGLPIARNIVTAHGGTITVANRTDETGAAATIRLPLLSPSSQHGENGRAYGVPIEGRRTA